MRLIRYYEHRDDAAKAGAYLTIYERQFGN